VEAQVPLDSVASHQTSTTTLEAVDLQQLALTAIRSQILALQQTRDHMDLVDHPTVNHEKCNRHLERK
jgi:hypothetical protein